MMTNRKRWCKDGGSGGIDVHHCRLVSVEGDEVLLRPALQGLQDVLKGQRYVVDGNAHRRVIDVLSSMMGVLQ